MQKGKRARRWGALLMGVAVLLSAAACSKTDTTNKANTETSSTTEAAVKAEQSTAPDPNAKVFSKPTKISIMANSHPSWPYNPDWKIWQYVKEATGAELDIQVVPSTEYATRVNLIIASRDQLPDLLHMIDKATADAHAISGAFVSILDNVDKLPNFKQWMDSTEEIEEVLAQRTSGDGKVYFFPTYGLHTINNMRTWMYRKDIFEKHNLQPPRDYNEMYEVAKKLKELYPDSYPVCSRMGATPLGNLQFYAPQMKQNLDMFEYYDFAAGKWGFGAVEEPFKELIAYYKKLYDEKLTPPDFISMATKSWQEVVSSGKGFMMMDYIIRLDFFNEPARKTDPKYTWAVMEPPKGSIATGTSKMAKTNFEFSGYLVCNTGKQENIENAFKFVDWMYSPKGAELLSWGKEGETYKLENGEKKFILDEKGTPARNLYGIGTAGLYQIVDPTSNEALYTRENVEGARKAINFLEARSNPKNWLSGNEQEIEIMRQTGKTIETYAEEQLSKFILGMRPISEWDAYVKEVEALGLDKLLDAYDKAYKRSVPSK